MVSDPVELVYFVVKAVALLCLGVNWFFSLTLTVVNAVNPHRRLWLPVIDWSLVFGDAVAPGRA